MSDMSVLNPEHRCPRMGCIVTIPVLAKPMYGIRARPLKYLEVSLYYLLRGFHQVRGSHVSIRQKKREPPFWSTSSARSTLKISGKLDPVTLPRIWTAEARPTPKTLRDRAILSRDRHIFGGKGNRAASPDCSKWLNFWPKIEPTTRKNIVSQKLLFFLKTYSDSSLNTKYEGLTRKTERDSSKIRSEISCFFTIFTTVTV